jgi:hypothetical protein
MFIKETNVGKLVMLAVRPDIFHRVEFRRIGRQKLGAQPALLIVDELLGVTAAMRRKAVPDQQQVAGNVTQQVLEELDDLLGLDRLF